MWNWASWIFSLSCSFSLYFFLSWIFVLYYLMTGLEFKKNLKGSSAHIKLLNKRLDARCTNLVFKLVIWCVRIKVLCWFNSISSLAIYLLIAVFHILTLSYVYRLLFCTRGRTTLFAPRSFTFHWYHFEVLSTCFFLFYCLFFLRHVHCV